MSNEVPTVDDEAHIRMLLEQTPDDLDEAGVSLLVASDGGAGLSAIRDERPQLALLDVMMPVTNGVDVCTVEADPGLSGTVMLTAKGQELDRDGGAEVGADLYVTRPLDPDDALQRGARP